jgi:pimeloyl-ACP methyl ester carboxylesterase
VYGTDVAWMVGLIDYWGEKFDWRAQEARLNAFPQYKVRLHDIDLHFLQVEGRGPDPCPLLLSHGWPGSVFEFLELIPRLTNPSQFGGDPVDSFTVVAPSLPGYGLSFSPATCQRAECGYRELVPCGRAIRARNRSRFSMLSTGRALRPGPAAFPRPKWCALWALRAGRLGGYR